MHLGIGNVGEEAKTGICNTGIVDPASKENDLKHGKSSLTSLSSTLMLVLLCQLCCIKPLAGSESCCIQNATSRDVLAGFPSFGLALDAKVFTARGPVNIQC